VRGGCPDRDHGRVRERGNGINLPELPPRSACVPPYPVFCISLRPG
jgi:hypothetical protein